MQNKNIHIELEEIEIKAERLSSLLLMLEQSVMSDNFGGKIFLPGISLITDLSDNIVKELTELRKKAKE